MTSRLTTALLTATLVGGGIVGASTLASAQYDGGSNDDNLEQPVDETVDEAEPTVDETETLDDPAPNPNALQQVDGDQEPTPGDGERRRGGCNDDEVASILGLTNQELRDARDDGSSLAAIAAAQGVETQALVDAMVEDKAERLAEKVAAGEITQEEADEKLARAEARAEERVSGDIDTDDETEG